ncbi:MAG: MarR family transcriptional regulator [Microbacterium sp.]
MARADEDLHEIVAELRLASFRLSRRLQSERDRDGLSDPQHTVVGHLIRVGEPRTIGALAEYQGVTAPTMNRTVNLLEAAGYVRRLGDPDDRRRVLVEATQRGVELIEATRRRRNEWLESQLVDLAPTDLAAIARAATLMLEISRR